MNVKNKIIALVMSFVVCFGTVSNSFANDKEQLNYNIEPLVVDGGVISAPMLATVSALAVGTGIVLKNSDDIYDIGRMFYDYIKSQTEMTWDFVQSAFLAGHTVIDNYVQVDSNFLDIVKGFFDNCFTDSNDKVSLPGLPIGKSISLTSEPVYYGNGGLCAFNDGISSGLKYYSESIGGYMGFYSVSGSYSSMIIDSISIDYEMYGSKKLKIVGRFIAASKTYNYTSYLSFSDFPSSIAMELPYSGGYDWDKVKDRESEGSVALPIPGNLDSLVGQGSDSFWDNTDSLVGGGSISLPGVNSPSIDVTDDVFVGSPSTDIPGVGNPSLPNEGIWSTIKDFVVSLVVPSDTFWTDTFNGFRDNFSKNFPMLDMSKFDSLAVGGKPFPNLYAYGSKIVDGDVINSIVDWLRPIVAGFIMICLMFFNYRKIYKLIRNTEPFGSIAQGSSDFRTGLSAPPINNGLDSNPMGNLRDTLFDMRNEILRRENSK